MQQEELWDREGLLDPAWERQQRKVSTVLHHCYYPVKKQSIVCISQN